MADPPASEEGTPRLHALHFVNLSSRGSAANLLSGTGAPMAAFTGSYGVILPTVLSFERPLTRSYLVEREEGDTQMFCHTATGLPNVKNRAAPGWPPMLSV